MAAANLLDMTERVALVTGASSGIGARCARVLAAAGAKTVLAARRTDRLEALRDEIERAGGTALFVAGERSTVRAFDAAEAAFGRVNTVIANAGITWVGRFDRYARNDIR